MDFSQFCSCGRSGYACLKERVDDCARQGRSYEFPQCRLPAGCEPAQADLGFWRLDRDYFLYLRPAVVYKGPCRLLSDFFAPGRLQHYSSFDALAERLHALDQDAASLRPANPTPELFRQLNERLQRSVLGQPQAVEAAAFKLYGHICKKQPARPLSLIFYGPTCVGKSELGKEIAPALNFLLGEARYQLVWTELNTFTEAHSVYRLTGAPPGYVGYEDEPVFSAVRRNPYAVFMFDELDKAHPEILKVFMSVLDEGRCAAHREDEAGGRELDFRRCIFLFTTNTDLSGQHSRTLGFAPPEEPASPANASSSVSPNCPAGLAQRLFQADETARQALVRSGVLREIAGRFSGLIGFQDLSRDTRIAITGKQIAALGREFGLEIVQVDPSISHALTPEAALSPRSNASILEGTLASFFLNAQQSCLRGPLALTGTLEALALLPAQTGLEHWTPQRFDEQRPAALLS